MPNQPPWRERVARAATEPAMPRRAIPYRGSTGAWQFWKAPGESDAGYRTLPESWKTGVRTATWLPEGARPPLLWLLNQRLWIYYTIAGFILVVGLGGVITLSILYSYLSKPVPIPTPIVGSATETGHIYAADGTLLADLHGPINRQSVPLGQMSTPIKEAVLAAEDSNFYQEKALDFRSILRAGITDFFAGRYVQGGSTITQQYVKLEYLGVQKNLKQKIQEARLAYQIERRLSKNQILERYLNTVYFGEGAYGVQAAALTYFNENASQLNVSQAAELAGIISSPSRNDPDVNPSGAEARRQYVLNRMQAVGFISASAFQNASSNPPPLSPPPPPGTSAYQDPYFVQVVRQYLYNKYGEALTLGGGLNVQTTLVPSQAAEAAAAVAKALPSAGDPAAAVVSVDPTTGYVTSLYGGNNFSADQFNDATQGRRQPGSAMKPFVLIAALEKGISPETVYAAPAQICIAGWLPTCEVSTYMNEAFGSATLEYATIQSINTVYAQLIMQVGPQNVVNVANAMGIPGPSWLLPASPGCRPAGSPACSVHLVAEPSLALGSEDVSPLEMASAYAVLADNGVYHAPKFVSKVTDGQGTVLEQGPSPGVQVVPSSIVLTVDRILHEVVTEGTGTAANLNRPQAGKTGTTSDYSNAWFVGYTPELSTAVWVGYQSSNQSLLNVEGVPQMAGGTIPAELWANYMKQALPPATAASNAADALYMGLNSPVSQGVTETVVSGTAITTVTNTSAAATCVLTPSNTAVAPVASPVTGTLYNNYPYLHCGAGGVIPTSGTATSTAGPGGTPTPAPTDTSTPPAPVVTAPESPIVYPSPNSYPYYQAPSQPTAPPSPTAPACYIPLLC
ncbi:MAG TPA: transglycosylase domain-containing protein [Actinomycetota bacterium]|nr:transglycosylase domain-containing protein [Actinomycetota bacterium]